jgi:hypothetical protein
MVDASTVTSSKRSRWSKNYFNYFVDTKFKRTYSPLMQTPRKYRVTDGGNVTGSFHTFKDAKAHLAGTTIINLQGFEVPLKDDGFYVEKWDANEWGYTLANFDL